MAKPGLILWLLIIVCALCRSHQMRMGHEYSKHQHWKPKEDICVANIGQEPQREGALSTANGLKAEPFPSLSVSPSTFSNNGEWVTVSYINISFASSTDWIGLFDASNEDYLNSAPIEFAYINIPANDTSFSISGTLKFQLINRRIDYIFVYCRTTTGAYRDIIAISNVISNPKKQLPMRLHIAVMPHNDSSKTNDMLINWVQLNVTKPQIKYGTSQNDLSNTKDATRIETYTRDDMCDVEYGQAAGNQGFFNPGWIISVILKDLKPNTQYFYKLRHFLFGVPIRIIRYP